MGHQYKIQYQKFLNTWVLAELTVHSPLEFAEFRGYVFQRGWLMDDGKTVIAPGCIQFVVAVA